MEAFNADQATSEGVVDAIGDGLSTLTPDGLRNAMGGGHDLKAISAGGSAGLSGYVAMSSIVSAGVSTSDGGFAQAPSGVFKEDK